MPGKLRVHELAKQLNVTSKELLATLKEQGEFVKSASSTVEPPVVKKMKNHYGVGAAKSEPAAGAAALPDLSSQPTAQASAPADAPAAETKAKPGASKPKPGAAKPKPAAAPAAKDASAADAAGSADSAAPDRKSVV